MQIAAPPFILRACAHSTNTTSQRASASCFQSRPSSIHKLADRRQGFAHGCLAGKMRAALLLETASSRLLLHAAAAAPDADADG